MQNQDSNCCGGVMSHREPWIKSLWRKLLRAYWKHTETAVPAETILRQGWNRPSFPTCPRCGKNNHVTHAPDLAKGQFMCFNHQPGESYFTPEVRAKDAIIVRCEVSVSFLDKLRLLLGCKLQFNGVIYTENVPGETKPHFDVFPVL